MHQEEYSFPKTGKKDFTWRSFYLTTNRNFSQHWQRDLFHVILLNRGAGCVKIDFRETQIQPPQAYFTKPNQVVGMAATEKCSGTIIGFNGSLCLEYENSAAGCKGILFQPPDQLPHIPLSYQEEEKLMLVLRAVKGELQQQASDQRAMLATYLRLILISCSRIKAKHTQKSKPTEKEFELKKRFIELVDIYYKTHHSVGDYAKMLGISPKSISKRFHQLNAGKPSDVIKHRIVLEAKRLLAFSDLSIKEIGFELGFDDPGYFSRFFKKATRLSPKSYREN